jgi:hypothetical protein
MADEGTLATSAEVLLAIGQGASAVQVLEANTNIWVKWAEGDMSIVADNDLVANVGDIDTNFLRYFAEIAANRAAWYAINQDQDNWSLATTQSKLNVVDSNWQDFKQRFSKDKAEVMATVGID